MITGDDVDAAMRAAGLRWCQLTKGPVDVTMDHMRAGWCNRLTCENLAKRGNVHGMTAEDVAAAVRAEVGQPDADPPIEGDDAAMRLLMSAP
jgi:hypothetical protein